ncbi:LysR family transcriptional regulator [Hylemonella gracilis str. Niagara R]|uniref:LysR family transcriptional regulator n=1 Tax=Hylemonella gracilis str. Niagara R TaxID=1458275 RepID=A0A016XHF4_9BURK|nr:LysR family transcriptional regulator [Hylemonella gracilis]EYC51514.1 LysR family transcriptional regulator [Hylemonella gracilis str. Niagara R]
MDRITAAQVFVTVAERGSLIQAAEQLEMSAATISRYLVSLEDWLGARLLHRTTRRVTLTDAGQLALPSCRQLLETADEVKQMAGNLRQEPRGRLRLTCALSFAEAQLTAALIEYQQRHPKVQISLTTTDREIDLAADQIDLAVRISNTLEPTLIARPLATCRSVICASPDYLLRHGTPTHLDELARHRCLVHALVSATQFRFRQGDKIVEPTVDVSFTTNETAILRRALLSGGGIGILPTYYVSEDIQRGALVPLLRDYPLETMGIHAVFLSRQHQPLALRLLVDFLVEKFGGEEPVWDRGLNGPSMWP